MGYQPGQSGNPGGRTKAHRELARYIREKTKDGRDLADICLKLATDDTAEARVRMLAIEWLGDRGIGKPVQASDLPLDDDRPPEAPIDWNAVPLEDRKRLLAALDEIDALAKLAGASGTSEY